MSRQMYFCVHTQKVYGHRVSFTYYFHLFNRHNIEEDFSINSVCLRIVLYIGFKNYFNSPHIYLLGINIEHLTTLFLTDNINITLSAPPAQYSIGNALCPLGFFIFSINLHNSSFIIDICAMTRRQAGKKT